MFTKHKIFTNTGLWRQIERVKEVDQKAVGTRLRIPGEAQGKIF